MLLLCAAGWVVLAGCQSDKTSSGSSDGVVIQGNTPGQIRVAAEEVCREHGFVVARPGSELVVVEKPGSRMNNIAYGNWVDKKGVWLRLKLTVSQVGEARHRLECQAFLVRDRGGSTEEEIRTRNRPYQSLLEEVAARLGQRPGS